MTRAAVVLTLPLMWALTATGSDDGANKLAGSWEAKDNPAHTWTFDQTDKGMHVIETENGKTIADFVCTLPAGNAISGARDMTPRSRSGSTARSWSR
jgi:hypothetical protein